MKTACDMYEHRHRTTKVLVIRCIAIICAVYISLVPLSAMAQPQRGQQQQLPSQRIPGHVIPLLADVKPIGPTPKNTQLHLAIALKLRDEASLDDLLTAQRDPTSFLYHRYLTRQEFNSRFAPTQATADAVTAYLRQQGLQVTAITPNHVLIDASATVATVGQAFAMSFNNYQLKTRVVYAPDTNPLIPNEMVDKIATISGLNNVALYHPTNLQRRLGQMQRHMSPNDGFTPNKLRTAYDVKPLLANKADGTGQTVGLFELDGYDPTDIATYRKYYHLATPKITNVLVDGASATPGLDALEVTLDMEVVSAMAPGAEQKIYIGLNTAAGVSDTYNRIVTDDVAKVISISWGECELASSAARLDLLDSIFKQGAAQGQAFFAASGDSGAYDCSDNSNTQKLAVDSPASDPYVIGVGGTTLETDSTGAYNGEITWGNPLATGNKVGIGGGGGKSAHFLRPSYQSGTNLTDPYRMVPDVSANADPTTGYSIYIASNQSSTGNTGWQIVGGTSAAAPLWAGIAADINQSLLAAHVSPIGSAISALYQLYNTPQIYPPYHDITRGSNLYYQAGPDYDLATGMGTPDAWNIARDLANSPGVATQLFQNGGFEDGENYWQQHSSGGYDLINTVNPHSGKHSAYLCGYTNCKDSILQTAAISMYSRKVTLNYWLYIGRGDTSTNCQDTFQVSLRTAKGVPIALIQKLCNTDANGWVPYSLDITDALTKYVGQTIQVNFEATGVSRQRSNFFVNIDDISLLTLTVVPGITTQLIKNPSFENGSAPWEEHSSGGYQLVANAFTHTGEYSAYLCGYTHCNDTISQTVVLPTSTRRATLSYWLYIGRADTNSECLDTFHAYLRLRTVQGALISTVQKLCNTDANGWTQYSYDVSADLKAYLGQPIVIDFEAVGLSTARANFFVDIDDVTLYATHD